MAEHDSGLTFEKCCNMDYVIARTCVHRMSYHLTWCTMYRRKVLDERIAARLKELLEEIAEEKGFSINSVAVCDMDSVECFVSAPPNVSATVLVMWIKGITGRLLLKEFPEITELLCDGQLWNGSYFVETIGTTNKEEMDRYVERQKRCKR